MARSAIPALAIVRNAVVPAGHAASPYSSSPAHQAVLAELNAPITDVLVSQELIRGMIKASDDADLIEAVSLDAGKIKVAYDEAYNTVRVHVGGRQGPVNLRLSVDRQVVKKIDGLPSLSPTEIDYLIRANVFSASFRDRIAVPPSEPDVDDFDYSNDIEIRRLVSAAVPQSTGCKPKFLELSALIHPRDLHGLKPGEDYVLLKHRPRAGRASTIGSEGLRSLRDIAEGPNAPAADRDRYTRRLAVTRFTNDPDLIYFRPVGRQFKIEADDMVVAARLPDVFVFDQEHRSERGTESSHRASAVPVAAYLAHEACGKRLPNAYGTVAAGRMQPWYVPEVCLKGGRVDPEFFIAHA